METATIEKTVYAVMVNYQHDLLKPTSSHNDIAAVKVAIFNHATKINPTIADDIRNSHYALEYAQIGYSFLRIGNCRYGIYAYVSHVPEGTTERVCERYPQFSDADFQAFVKEWGTVPWPQKMEEPYIQSKKVYTVTAEPKKGAEIDLGLKTNSPENNLAALKAAIFEHATQKNPSIAENLRCSLLIKTEAEKGAFALFSSGYHFDLAHTTAYISLSIGDSVYKIHTYTQRSIGTTVSISTPHQQTDATLQLFANEWDTASWPQEADEVEADVDSYDIQLIDLDSDELSPDPQAETEVPNDNVPPPPIINRTAHLQVPTAPAPNYWSKRISFFLLNPLTYLVPAVLVAIGLMIAWVQMGVPLFAEISMLTIGTALGLGAITTSIAILSNVSSMFKEKMPIEEYLWERSQWSYMGAAVGIALFLTALMVTLTLFSDKIPFLNDFFNYLLQGMKVGMGEFAKFIDAGYFVSPDFLNAFSAVLKVIVVLTPAILIDTIGRFATRDIDYKYPDQFVPKEDRGGKFTADNSPPNKGEQKYHKPPVGQPGGHRPKNPQKELHGSLYGASNDIKVS